MGSRRWTSQTMPRPRARPNLLPPKTTASSPIEFIQTRLYQLSRCSDRFPHRAPEALPPKQTLLSRGSAAGGRRGGERRGRARAFAWFPAGGSDGPIESREGGGPARLETTMGGQQQNENGDKGPTRWVESLSLAEGPSFDTAAHSILPSFVRPNAQEFRRS